MLGRSSNRWLKYSIYAGVAAALPVAVEKLVMRKGGMDDILSMTGRLPFWKALINEGLPREPLLGFGFMRIDYKDHFESVHTYAGSHDAQYVYAGIDEPGIYRTVAGTYPGHFYGSWISEGTRRKEVDVAGHIDPCGDQFIYRIWDFWRNQLRNTVLSATDIFHKSLASLTDDPGREVAPAPETSRSFALTVNLHSLYS